MEASTFGVRIELMSRSFSNTSVIFALQRWN